LVALISINFVASSPMRQVYELAAPPPVAEPQARADVNAKAQKCSWDENERRERVVKQMIKLERSDMRRAPDTPLRPDYFSVKISFKAADNCGRWK
jgi:hypothetical protein